MNFEELTNSAAFLAAPPNVKLGLAQAHWDSVAAQAESEEDLNRIELYRKISIGGMEAIGKSTGDLGDGTFKNLYANEAQAYNNAWSVLNSDRADEGMVGSALKGIEDSMRDTDLARKADFDNLNARITRSSQISAALRESITGGDPLQEASLDAALKRDTGLKRVTNWASNNEWEMPVGQYIPYQPEMSPSSASIIDKTLDFPVATAATLGNLVGSLATFGASAAGMRDTQHHAKIEAFRKANNLTDEEVMNAYSDMSADRRDWKPDELFRTLSSGKLIPNIGAVGLLDEQETSKAVLASSAPEAAKLDFLDKIGGYRDASTDKLFEGLSILSKDHELQMEDFGEYFINKKRENPELSKRDIVSAYVKKEKFSAGGALFSELMSEGSTKLAQTFAGAAGLVGVTPLGDWAAETSRDNQKMAAAASAVFGEQTWIDSVAKEGPSVLATVLLTRGAGTAAMGTARAFTPLAAGATAAEIGAATATRMSVAQGAGMVVGVGSSALQSAGITYSDNLMANLDAGMNRDEAHVKAQEKGIIAGITTGLVTGTFSRLGMGGIESAGLSRMTVGELAEESAKRGIPFADAARAGIANVIGGLTKFNKYAGMAASGVSKVGGAGIRSVGWASRNKVAQGVFNEGAEEGIDQILGKFLTADPGTPVYNAFSEGWEAAKVGGVFGLATGTTEAFAEGKRKSMDAAARAKALAVDPEKKGTKVLTEKELADAADAEAAAKAGLKLEPVDQRKPGEITEVWRDVDGNLTGLRHGTNGVSFVRRSADGTWVDEAGSATNLRAARRRMVDEGLMPVVGKNAEGKTSFFSPEQASAEVEGIRAETEERIAAVGEHRQRQIDERFARARERELQAKQAITASENAARVAAMQKQASEETEAEAIQAALGRMNEEQRAQADLVTQRVRNEQRLDRVEANTAEALNQEFSDSLKETARRYADRDRAESLLQAQRAAESTKAAEAEAAGPPPTRGQAAINPDNYVDAEGDSDETKAKTAEAKAAAERLVQNGVTTVGQAVSHSLDQDLHDAARTGAAHPVELLQDLRSVLESGKTPGFELVQSEAAPPATPDVGTPPAAAPETPATPEAEAEVTPAETPEVGAEEAPEAPVEPAAEPAAESEAEAEAGVTPEAELAEIEAQIEDSKAVVKIYADRLPLDEKRLADKKEQKAEADKEMAAKKKEKAKLEKDRKKAVKSKDFDGAATIQRQINSVDQDIAEIQSRIEIIDVEGAEKVASDTKGYIETYEKTIEILDKQAENLRNGLDIFGDPRVTPQTQTPTNEQAPGEQPPAAETPQENIPEAAASTGTEQDQGPAPLGEGGPDPEVAAILGTVPPVITVQELTTTNTVEETELEEIKISVGADVEALNTPTEPEAPSITDNQAGKLASDLAGTNSAPEAAEVSRIAAEQASDPAPVDITDPTGIDDRGAFNVPTSRFGYRSQFPISMSARALNKFVSSLGKRFNLNIQWATDMPDDRYGEYDPNTGRIRLNKNLIAKSAETPLHEVSHALLAAIKKSNPALYNALVMEMNSLIDSDEQLQRLRNRIIDAYPGLDESYIMDELMATYLGVHGDEKLARQSDLSTPESKAFADKIWKHITEFFRNMFRGRMSVADLEPDTNMGDLIKMITDPASFYDIGGPQGSADVTTRTALQEFAFGMKHAAQAALDSIKEGGIGVSWSLNKNGVPTLSLILGSNGVADIQRMSLMADNLNRDVTPQEWAALRERAAKWKDSKLGGDFWKGFEHIEGKINTETNNSPINVNNLTYLIDQVVMNKSAWNKAGQDESVDLTNARIANHVLNLFHDMETGRIRSEITSIPDSYTNALLTALGQNVDILPSMGDPDGVFQQLAPEDVEKFAAALQHRVRMANALIAFSADPALSDDVGLQLLTDLVIDEHAAMVKASESNLAFGVGDISFDDFANNRLNGELQGWVNKVMRQQAAAGVQAVASMPTSSVPRVPTTQAVIAAANNIFDHVQKTAIAKMLGFTGWTSRAEDALAKRFADWLVDGRAAIGKLGDVMEKISLYMRGLMAASVVAISLTSATAPVSTTIPLTQVASDFGVRVEPRVMSLSSIAKAQLRASNVNAQAQAMNQQRRAAAPLAAATDIINRMGAGVPQAATTAPRMTPSTVDAGAVPETATAGVEAQGPTSEAIPMGFPAENVDVAADAMEQQRRAAAPLTGVSTIIDGMTPATVREALNPAPTAPVTAFADVPEGAIPTEVQAPAPEAIPRDLASAQEPVAAPATTIPRADFSGVTVSDDVGVMANWIIQNDNAEGKPFMVADKEEGTVNYFDANGKLVRKAPALFGRLPGDFVLLEGTSFRTPAGRFEAEQYMAEDYGKTIRFDRVENSNFLIHRIPTHSKTVPKAVREKAIKTESGADNRVTSGCINLGGDMINFNFNHFEDGGFIYVTPETEEGVASFGGFKALKGGKRRARRMATARRGPSKPPKSATTPVRIGDGTKDGLYNAIPADAAFRSPTGAGRIMPITDGSPQAGFKKVSEALAFRSKMAAREGLLAPELKVVTDEKGGEVKYFVVVPDPFGQAAAHRIGSKFAVSADINNLSALPNTTELAPYVDNSGNNVIKLFRHMTKKAKEIAFEHKWLVDNNVDQAAAGENLSKAVATNLTQSAWGKYYAAAVSKAMRAKHGNPFGTDRNLKSPTYGHALDVKLKPGQSPWMGDIMQRSMVDPTAYDLTPAQTALVDDMRSVLEQMREHMRKAHLDKNYLRDGGFELQKFLDDPTVGDNSWREYFPREVIGYYDANGRPQTKPYVGSASAKTTHKGFDESRTKDENGKWLTQQQMADQQSVIYSADEFDIIEGFIAKGYSAIAATDLADNLDQFVVDRGPDAKASLRNAFVAGVPVLNDTIFTNEVANFLNQHLVENKKITAQTEAILGASSMWKSLVLGFDLAGGLTVAGVGTMTQAFRTGGVFAMLENLGGQVMDVARAAGTDPQVYRRLCAELSPYMLEMASLNGKVGSGQDWMEINKTLTRNREIMNSRSGKQGAVAAAVASLGRFGDRLSDYHRNVCEIGKCQMWRSVRERFLDENGNLRTDKESVDAMREEVRSIDRCFGYSNDQDISMTSRSSRAWQNILMTAPGMYISMINNVTTVAGIKHIGEWAGASMIYFIAAAVASGMDEDEIKARCNPLNKAFMKVDVDMGTGGKLRVGFSQFYSSLFVTAAKQTDVFKRMFVDGETLTFGEMVAPVTNFARNRLNVPVTAVIGMATGEDYMGKHISTGGAIVRSMTPTSLQDPLALMVDNVIGTTWLASAEQHFNATENETLAGRATTFIANVAGLTAYTLDTKQKMSEVRDTMARERYGVSFKNMEDMGAASEIALEVNQRFKDMPKFTNQEGIAELQTRERTRAAKMIPSDVKNYLMRTGAMDQVRIGGIQLRDGSFMFTDGLIRDNHYRAALDQAINEPGGIRDQMQYAEDNDIPPANQQKQALDTVNKAFKSDNTSVAARLGIRTK